MKKFDISQLLLVIISLGLFLNISYAETKEFLYTRDAMPDYLFSMHDNVSELMQKRRPKELSQDKLDAVPKLPTTRYHSIIRTMMIVKFMWDNRIFTENINTRDAKNWLRMQVQDRHNITNVEIKHIEMKTTREEAPNTLSGKKWKLSDIREDYRKFFPNGVDTYKTTRKIEWVVFEITYKPEQVTNIRTNVNVNNGNEPAHGFVFSERL